VINYAKAPKMTKEAKGVLSGQDGAKKFQEKYGDYFIAGIIVGAEAGMMLSRSHDSHSDVEVSLTLFPACVSLCVYPILYTTLFRLKEPFDRNLHRSQKSQSRLKSSSGPNRSASQRRKYHRSIFARTASPASVHSIKRAIPLHRAPLTRPRL